MPALPTAQPNPVAYARVQKIARILDEVVPIPFTKIRLGLDSIIGLIPVVGDAAGLLIGGYLVAEAHYMGAPTALKLKMARNVVIDAIAGLVPVLGDAVDMLYRSNRRNMDMLTAHFRPAEARPRRAQGLGYWAVRVGLMAATAAGVWWWCHR